MHDKSRHHVYDDPYSQNRGLLDHVSACRQEFFSCPSDHLKNFLIDLNLVRASIMANWLITERSYDAPIRAQAEDEEAICTCKER